MASGARGNAETVRKFVSLEPAGTARRDYPKASAGVPRFAMTPVSKLPTGRKRMCERLRHPNYP
jgi:hypothetical protein